jgi:hypothetical protein
MILRHQKYEIKITHIIFTLRISIMHFYQNLALKDTVTMLRRNLKKSEPDHPSTFMEMVKERTRTMSAVNDERRQVLPSNIIWDGTIDHFGVFRNNFEVYCHYGLIGAGYLFDSSFQEDYLEWGVDCYADFLDEVPSASQIKKDARAFYYALLSACQSGVGRRI